MRRAELATRLVGETRRLAKKFIAEPSQLVVEAFKLGANNAGRGIGGGCWRRGGEDEFAAHYKSLHHHTRAVSTARPDFL